MTKQLKRHPHADVIIAFAEGKNIQFKYDGRDWWDFNNFSIVGFDDSTIKWRVKPEVRKYRIALMRSDNMDITPYPCIADAETTANNWEKSNSFVRWLTDWIEYEV